MKLQLCYRYRQKSKVSCKGVKGEIRENWSRQWVFLLVLCWIAFEASDNPDRPFAGVFVIRDRPHFIYHFSTFFSVVHMHLTTLWFLCDISTFLFLNWDPWARIVPLLEFNRFVLIFSNNRFKTVVWSWSEKSDYASPESAVNHWNGVQWMLSFEFYGFAHLWLEHYFFIMYL